MKLCAAALKLIISSSSYRHVNLRNEEFKSEHLRVSAKHFVPVLIVLTMSFCNCNIKIYSTLANGLCNSCSVFPLKYITKKVNFMSISSEIWLSR